jgi:hypothetical protein
MLCFGRFSIAAIWASEAEGKPRSRAAICSFGNLSARVNTFMARWLIAVGTFAIT